MNKTRKLFCFLCAESVKQSHQAGQEQLYQPPSAMYWQLNGAKMFNIEFQFMKTNHIKQCVMRASQTSTSETTMWHFFRRKRQSRQCLIWRGAQAMHAGAAWYKPNFNGGFFVKTRQNMIKLDEYWLQDVLLACKPEKSLHIYSHIKSLFHFFFHNKKSFN